MVAKDNAVGRKERKAAAALMVVYLTDDEEECAVDGGVGVESGVRVES